jgi:hypothetical protein
MCRVLESSQSRVGYEPTLFPEDTAGEDGVGFEPTVVLRHWINSPDFSASKATHPFVDEVRFELTFSTYHYVYRMYKIPTVLVHVLCR